MKHPELDDRRSRRTFLRGCGLTLTGFGLSSLFPTPLIRQALAGGLPSDRRLLFVFLRGGNDGLNAVIPHGDPDYNATIRPTLYLPPASAIDLNGFASLHPALADLEEAYRAGDLAVIHRVGYPDNTRSHFDDQRVWENGDPSQPQLFEGWLYRYVQQAALSQSARLPVLTCQSLPPVLVQGDEPFVNVANPGGFQYVVGEPLRSKLAAGWRERADGLVGLEPYRPLLSQTGVKLADTLSEYDSWDQAGWDPKDPDTGWSLFPVSPATDQAGFGQQAYGFFGSLKIAALALLESEAGGNGTRIAGTELGGWDTHNNQGQTAGTQAALFRQLAYGFRSLRIVLSGAANDPRAYPSIWERSIVVTMSEFGRTTQENGSRGTDHAAASCMFAMGGTVNGGVYNCDNSTWPAGVMYGVNGRYLLQRTDYRAVFWEILRDHMQAQATAAETIFPGYGGLGLSSQELSLIAG